MNEYREFQGKTLDEAIRDACSFYDLPREKLEIDIINDAKGGIFGLVGARKALIRARRVQLGSVLDDLDAPLPKKTGKLTEKDRHDKAGEDAPATGQDEAPRRERPARRGRDGRKQAPAAENVSAHSVKDIPSSAVDAAPAGGCAARSSSADGPAGGGRQPKSRDARPRRGRSQDKARAGEAQSAGTNDFPASADAADAGSDDLPRIPFEQLDAEQLQAVTREVAVRLTSPLLGDVPFQVACGGDRVRISFSNLEDPGLLIGREGQTLASLQYLATRMVSNHMKALVRVQIDAGDYRERQDERLRDMALSLAEKVKSGGRPQLTRPLSSYHRRVIHVTLQDDPLVQTHSKGEGEMKRVVIALRRK